MRKKMLNIGCGTTYHREWINIDIQSQDRNVIEIDIRKGLPYQNNSIDCIYCSHVIEHLTSLESESLLKECYRILKPRGVIRLLVPDLETIVVEYLQMLKKVKKNNKYAEKYKWIKLELLDQLTRTQSGGEMLSYLYQANSETRKYILNRIGYEAEFLWNKVRQKKYSPYIEELLYRMKKVDFKWLIETSRKYLLLLLVRLFGGKKLLEIFKIALFRSVGEIHLQMYDQYALSTMLSDLGYKKITRKDFGKSIIPSFNKFSLDTINGKPRKPDSLIVEAIK